jgi:hypothetical protein
MATGAGNTIAPKTAAGTPKRIHKFKKFGHLPLCSF